MKAELNENVKTSRDAPIILRHTTHDLVVLKMASDSNDFTFSGVVLYVANCRDRKIGDYDTGWAESQFEPLSGNVVLSNE